MILEVFWQEFFNCLSLVTVLDPIEKGTDNQYGDYLVYTVKYISFPAHSSFGVSTLLLGFVARMHNSVFYLKESNFPKDNVGRIA